MILLAKKYPNLRVINFDKLDYCACLKNLSSVESLSNYHFVRVRSHQRKELELTLVKGDILQPDLVNHVLKEQRVDSIIHFAAQTHVGMCKRECLMDMFC